MQHFLIKRTIWQPRTILSTSRLLSRATLGIAGGTVATITYYGDKATRWGNEKLEDLSSFLKSLQFPQFNAVMHQRKASEHPDDGGDVQISKSQQIAKDASMLRLTKKLLEVKNILLSVDQDRFQLPAIVVIGSQSSGKSSLLEAIVGQEFLPKGLNMVTRRPIEVTLIHTPDSGEEYADFPRHGLKNIYDFDRVQKIIADLNLSVSEQECVSDNPIDLRIYSPNVPDLTLIDLPGFIAINNKNQPEVLKSKIVALCRKYIREPNIILAVSAADADLANSEALNESRKVDPEGSRTLGVLTKIDLVEPLRIVQMIQSEDFPLKLGYIGVICKDVDSANQEQAFIKVNYTTFVPVSQSLGVDVLRTNLVTVLEQNMLKSLGTVKEKVSAELEDIRYKFKVEYDDRQITAESYAIEVIDNFKQQFKQAISQYGRPQMRDQVRQLLDEQVLDTLMQFQYNDELFEKMSNPSVLTEEEKRYLKMLLDKVQASFTKSGVGKVSTKAVVDKTTQILDTILQQPLFQNHPETVKSIRNISEDLLKARISTSIDQVENTIKPYKYDVDYTKQEWSEGLQRSIQALHDKIKVHQQVIDTIQSQMGRRKLRSVVSYVQSKQNLSLFSQEILEQAEVVIEQQQQIHRLQQRVNALQPGWIFRSICQNTPACKPYCPEPYLFHIASKIADTAVMFIWAELLSEFLYSLPREIDAKVYYSKDEEAIQAFAQENPQVRRHLQIQQKKEVLEKASIKLSTL